MPAKAKPRVQKKSKTADGGKKKSSVQAKSKTKAEAKKKTRAVEKAQVVNRIAAPRITISSSKGKKKVKNARTVPQYSFMKAPGDLHDFQVGKKIEVYCDHDKSKERIRGWIDGTIVQIDNKMVAVQFRSNVYLTDGWMVPDRILWYPLNSEHVRPVGGGKAAKRNRTIPEY
jgi:hypothetical protein